MASFSKLILLAVLTAVFLSACASKPIIDPKGVNMAQYEEDLQDCELVARQVQTGATVAKSTAAGAAVGAAYGLIDGHDVGRDAAYGAVAGGSSGAFKSDEEKARVTKNCLRHRGYAVLN